MFEFFTQLQPEMLIVVLLACILIVMMMIAIVLQIYHSMKMDRIADPIYEHVVAKARTRANEIIGGAMDQARQLRVEGELQGIKAVARDKVEAKKLLQEYEHTLTELTQQTTEYIKSRGAEAVASYNSLSNSLEEEMRYEADSLRDAFKAGNATLARAFEELTRIGESANGAQEKTLEQLRVRADQQTQKLMWDLGARAERTVADFDARLKKVNDDLERSFGVRIATALSEAEKDIGAYKQRRLSIIDRDIVGLVAHVTSTVLRKKLSVAEHAELAERALRDAGANGVFSDAMSASRKKQRS